MDIPDEVEEEVPAPKSNKPIKKISAPKVCCQRVAGFGAQKSRANPHRGSCPSMIVHAVHELKVAVPMADVWIAGG